MIDVTHRDAEYADELRASRRAVAQRVVRQREVEKLADRLPAQFRSRGTVRVSDDGQTIEQTFSCNCGKPEHDHERNPFAGIIEPTAVVFLTPEEAEARDLAERVNQTRST